MLKIKDEVDLKELEKFGLHKHSWGKYLENYDYVRYEVGNELLCISGNNYDDYVKGQITIETTKFAYHSVVAQILFDLIQAGLVERVE